MHEQHILIVGGGITGLSAAFYLKKLASRQHGDIRCTVIEKDARLGGKIRTYREDGLVLEGGPDSILARKPAGVGLIRELGVESEMVGTNPIAHRTYIVHNGRLERLPPGTNMGIPTKLRPFASTRLLSVRGKARALLDLVISRGNMTDDVSLGHFLRRRLGDEVVNNIAEPLLAGIFAGNVDHLSLESTFPQFRTLIEKHGSLIRGSLAQSRQAKPNDAAQSGRSVFTTLRAGLETIVERLYDELHTWADIHTNTAAKGVCRLENGQYGVTVEGPDGTQQLAADALIVTSPASVAADLLSPLVPEATALADIPYVSTATVMLCYAKDSITVDLDASGFVIPRGERRNITACTWVSSKWPHTSTDDRVLIRCYVGRDGQQDNLRLSDPDMVAVVESELRDLLGITARPWFTKVTRWDNAMPQYTVGHKERVLRVTDKLRQTAPGVYIAGAGYRGVGIPDCIADAAQTVDELMNWLK